MGQAYLTYLEWTLSSELLLTVFGGQHDRLIIDRLKNTKISAQWARPLIWMSAVRSQAHSAMSKIAISNLNVLYVLIFHVKTYWRELRLEPLFSNFNSELLCRLCCNITLYKSSLSIVIADLIKGTSRALQMLPSTTCLTLLVLLRVPLRVQPAYLPQAYILCSIIAVLSMCTSFGEECRTKNNVSLLKVFDQTTKMPILALVVPLTLISHRNYLYFLAWPIGWPKINVSKKYLSWRW